MAVSSGRSVRNRDLCAPAPRRSHPFGWADCRQSTASGRRLTADCVGSLLITVSDLPHTEGAFFCKKKKERD